MIHSRYRTICADPPWPYQTEGPRSSPTHRPNSWNKPLGCVSSESRYGSLSLEHLKKFPVADIVECNAHLYLWTTNSFIVEAHELAGAWGFKPKTLITWGKVKPDGTPSMKSGYYFRGATEHILFCVRGSIRLNGPACPTLFLSPRLPHSVKPEWFYRMVEEQSTGPYLDMFARTTRLGWDFWGNEVPVGEEMSLLETAAKAGRLEEAKALRMDAEKLYGLTGEIHDERILHHASCIFHRNQQMCDCGAGV